VIGTVINSLLTRRVEVRAHRSLVEHSRETPFWVSDEGCSGRIVGHSERAQRMYLDITPVKSPSIHPLKCSTRSSPLKPPDDADMR
jgi:hypothetical protein